MCVCGGGREKNEDKETSKRVKKKGSRLKVRGSERGQDGKLCLGKGWRERQARRSEILQRRKVSVRAAGSCDNCDSHFLLNGSANRGSVGDGARRGSADNSMAEWQGTGRAHLIVGFGPLWAHIYRAGTSPLLRGSQPVYQQLRDELKGEAFRTC